MADLPARLSGPAIGRAALRKLGLELLVLFLKLLNARDQIGDQAHLIDGLERHGRMHNIPRTIQFRRQLHLLDQMRKYCFQLLSYEAGLHA